LRALPSLFFLLPPLLTDGVVRPTRSAAHNRPKSNADGYSPLPSFLFRDLRFLGGTGSRMGSVSVKSKFDTSSLSPSSFLSRDRRCRVEIRPSHTQNRGVRKNTEKTDDKRLSLFSFPFFPFSFPLFYRGTSPPREPLLPGRIVKTSAKR